MLNNEVVERARKFCDEHGINEYPVKIIEVCKSLGLSVFERYLPENVSGFIVVQDENFMDFNTNRLIAVNQYDNSRRKRFTIAHELAHYVLHKGENALYAHRDAGQHDRTETEANLFASVVLMPEELIRDSIEALGQEEWDDLGTFLKPQYIASEFAVSYDAAAIRLKQLGLR